jgi:amino acid permease
VVELLFYMGKLTYSSLEQFLHSIQHLTCLLSLLNILAVGNYGELEFWLSSGKVFLVFILFGFTLSMMLMDSVTGRIPVLLQNGILPAASVALRGF